jgi:pimeloyl-ACP methyl ester carboxylesterase
MSEAKLSGTQLFGANLQTARFLGPRELSAARIDRSTQLPQMFTGEYDVRLADGRILRVQDTGHIGDPTVIFFHGMPPSPLQYESGLAVAAANLRLLAYDRPGYGGSTPKPDRTITDVAADVAAIAHELDVEHFAVWGASGGGPYALACAALLADRVVAAAVAPTLAPYDAAGLDWFAGMAQMDVQRFKLTISGRDVLQPELASQAATFRAVDPAQFIELVGPVLSPPDRAILDTELATSLLDTVREMLSPTVAGFLRCCW